MAFNSQVIHSKRELIEDIRALDGQDVEVEVLRNDKDHSAHPHSGERCAGAYKLGIWVRDNTQGIGTLTFVDEDGRYGALGHGISDIDTGKLLKIESGALLSSRDSGSSERKQWEIRENLRD